MLLMKTYGNPPSFDIRATGYVDDPDLFYCPTYAKYWKNQLDDSHDPGGYYWWSGYSHCVPGAGWGSGIGCRIEDDNKPIDTGWSNLLLQHVQTTKPAASARPKYRAWVACARMNGPNPVGSPHGNEGMNAVYRDGSVRFITRPNDGWGTLNWFGPTGTEMGNIGDADPFWWHANMETGETY